MQAPRRSVSGRGLRHVAACGLALLALVPVTSAELSASPTTAPPMEPWLTWTITALFIFGAVVVVRGWIFGIFRVLFGGRRERRAAARAAAEEAAAAAAAEAAQEAPSAVPLVETAPTHAVLPTARPLNPHQVAAQVPAPAVAQAAAADLMAELQGQGAAAPQAPAMAVQLPGGAGPAYVPQPAPSHVAHHPAPTAGVPTNAGPPRGPAPGPGQRPADEPVEEGGLSSIQAQRIDAPLPPALGGPPAAADEYDELMGAEGGSWPTGPVGAPPLDAPASGDADAATGDARRGKLEAGCYLLPAGDATDTILLKWLAYERQSKAPTLVIGRWRKPEIERQLGAGPNIEVAQLSVVAESEDTLSPRDLSMLQDRVARFLRDHPSGLVGIEGVEMLLMQNDFSTLMKTIHMIRDHQARSPDAVVMFCLQPTALPDDQRAMLERELTNLSGW